MTHNFNAILEQMGLPTFALNNGSGIIPQPTGDPTSIQLPNDTFK